MAFWNKDKDGNAPKHANIGRNDPCHCGSGKKYKKCCADKDAAADRKILEANWSKTSAEAKEQAEKNAKDSKDTSTAPKHGGATKPTQSKHQKFVPSQVSTPRKSGGG